MQFSLTPWNYDDETVAIVRKFAELHATTIGDEIEAVAKEAVEHGITTVFFYTGPDLAGGRPAGTRLLLWVIRWETGWLGSRVVSVLDSVAEGPGFKSQP